MRVDADIAIFAGGCFWHMDAAFRKLEGVTNVYTGYTGGQDTKPTYQKVVSGASDHVEAVEVHFDPNVITYDKLLQNFWDSVDVMHAGSHSAIFYTSGEQKELAEKSKNELEASKRFDKPIVTKIAAATTFYKAEAEHQDYYKKSKLSYNMSELFSGRDSFIENVWGKDREVKISAKQVFNKEFNKEEKLKTLTKVQYNVTQNGADEQPFNNEYWDNKEEGIYVDIVSGEPLFSSKDKFDAGTGWPSFTKPLESSNIVLKEHGGLFSRIEVRSRNADSFLGDVFKDGPQPTGLRFCVNSAAMEWNLFRKPILKKEDMALMPRNLAMNRIQSIPLHLNS